MARPQRPLATATRVRLGVALGTLFLATALLVLLEPRPDVDVAVATWVASQQVPWVMTVMDGLRAIAAQLPLVVTPVVAVVLWRTGAAGQAGRLLAAVTSSLVIGVVAKMLVARPGPDAEPLQMTPAAEETGWSFPSSSVAVAVAFWGTLLALAFPTRHAGRALLVTTSVLAVASIGVSRIYVGEHWFTDVVAGYLLGAAVVVAGPRFRQCRGGPRSPRRVSRFDGNT